ncbi:MAG: DUF927 domain-containing protein [Bdellovibrionales bacterium]
MLYESIVNTVTAALLLPFESLRRRFPSFTDENADYVLPMASLAGDGTAYREELLSLGLRLAPNGNKLLHSYIIMANPKARGVCVQKTGWHNGCYVLPQRVYGQKSGERIVLQQTRATKSHVSRGTLQEWQQSIGRLCVGNSRLVFVVCVALTGPLLEPLGEENFGCHGEGDRP